MQTLIRKLSCLLTPFLLFACGGGSGAPIASSQLTPTPLSAQMIYSDNYSCALLPICSSGQSAGLSCVTQTAYNKCVAMQSLNQSGISLNDSNNLYISTFQHQHTTPLQWPFYMNITTPTTLFAGFTMTYNPDISAPSSLVGWPVNSSALQQQAYESSSPNTCLPYTNNSITSYGPWLSHCSAFTAWAESQVFAVQVPPTQPQAGLGYDWCGLANKNNAGLSAGENGWVSVQNYSTQSAQPVVAQILANMGCAVVANYLNTNAGAGHIAPVLPSTWQLAQTLQHGSNYPLNVIVTNSSTFESFIAQVGPEEMQAGLYNFQHTVVLNGFYSELVTPSDYTTIMYFYNPSSCQ